MNLHSFVRSRTCRAFAALLGLTVLVTVSADELRLPEEALYEQMQAGDVVAARAGFVALVTKYIDRFNAVPADHPKASEARIIQATQLVSAFRMWQLAEVEQRLAGKQAPGDLNKRMATFADALIQCAASVDQVGRQPGTASDLPEWLDQDRQKLIQQLGQTMLETAVFLRDADLEPNRLRLLQAAGRYTAAPATLKELDAQ